MPETPPRPEATVADARALAHPLRLRIIRLLYDRSLTNRELARALGEHPATVLHHVRTLLRTGFIAADPARPGPRGTVEKPYRSTGRSWSLSIDDNVVTDIVISDCAPDDRVAVWLVQAQWAELSARYGEPDPEPSSIRDPSAFVAPTGAFVMLHVAGQAAGCGGICRYDDATAELKAIYVSPLHRGHGYSRRLVRALETRAVSLGYRAVRLETGDAQPEAIALYTRLGYARIESFGVYRDSPGSICFERELEPVR
jgi:GNAT superfamily N-acetyltransferase